METGCIRTRRCNSTTEQRTPEPRATVPQSLRGEGSKVPTRQHSRPTNPKASRSKGPHKGCRASWTATEAGILQVAQGSPSCPSCPLSLCPGTCHSSWEGKTFLGRSSFKHLPLMNSNSNTHTLSLSPGPPSLSATKNKNPTPLKGKGTHNPEGMNEGERQKPSPLKPAVQCAQGRAGECRRLRTAWAGVSGSRPISNLPPGPGETPLERKRNRWVEAQ